MAPSFDLDLTNYKDRFGDNLPDGRYHVTVDDLEMDKSKAGNPMVNVWYRVAEGDQAGMTQIDRLTITDKALFRVVGFLNAVGLPTPKKRLSIPFERIVGKHLFIDVQQGEPYNGRTKSEVRGYARLTRGGGESSGGADLADLDEVPVTSAAAPEPDEVAETPAPAAAEPAPAESVAALAERRQASGAETPAHPDAPATPDPETVSLDDIDL